MNAYVLDLTASFVVGGTWVTLASVTAQRFGGKIGGFIAGLPATSVLAIFFITYTEGARHGFDVTGVFPLAISVNAVFLAAFAAFSRKSFSLGLLASLGIWIVVQSVLLHFHPIRFGVVVTFGIVLFLISLLFISSLDIPDPGTQPVHHGVAEITIRAISGGTIIVLAMIGSRMGGPILGGILSAFPATVVATLIITDTYGGRDLTRVMAQPMMISGVVNCMVFALVYRHVVLYMDVLGALTSAYAVTLVSAACTFYWMNIHHSEHSRAIHT
ncbi:MAG: DUF3147 family protein [Deltaproteobacteria bacterium]|nr:MAG: DUF3147 family protein [Deltaproteobacteria bacterium]